MKNSHNIHIIASSITGSYHKARNMPCQDNYKYKKTKSKIVAIVSDGAGSAKYGHIGAKIICNTMCDILINASFTDIKQKIIDAISIARDKLTLHRFNKTKDEQGLIDFAATLVGVYYNNGKGLFFHIGDGAAIAFMNDNSTTISQPENGIFACETYFYTMEDWKDSLRFTNFKKANNLMLMTDGVTGFAFKNDYEDIETKFLYPINSFLQNTPNKSKALRALNNTLSNPKASKINPDDKTLLWVKLK